jgi:hypothetical protein
MIVHYYCYCYCYCSYKSANNSRSWCYVISRVIILHNTTLNMYVVSCLASRLSLTSLKISGDTHTHTETQTRFMLWPCPKIILSGHGCVIVIIRPKFVPYQMRMRTSCDNGGDRYNRHSCHSTPDV